MFPRSYKEPAKTDAIGATRSQVLAQATYVLPKRPRNLEIADLSCFVGHFDPLRLAEETPDVCRSLSAIHEISAGPGGDFPGLSVYLDSDCTPTIRAPVDQRWSPGFQAVIDVELHP